MGTKGHFYKIKTERKCGAGCGRVATHEVRNTHNATMGHYCSKCADREIARLKGDE